MRQRWRLAEVKCEDYAFVLLSRCINRLEQEVCICVEGFSGVYVRGLAVGVYGSGWVEVGMMGVAFERDTAEWVRGQRWLPPLRCV